MNHAFQYSLPIELEKHFSLAEKAIKNEDYFYVIQLASYALQFQPFNTQLRSILNQALLKSYEKKNPLVKLFKNLIAIPKLISTLGDLYKKKPKKALLKAYEYLILKPNTVLIRKWIIKLTAQLKMSDLHTQALVELTQIKPNCPKTHMMLATNYFNKKQYDKALETGESIIAKYPSYVNALDLVHRAAIAESYRRHLS